MAIRARVWAPAAAAVFGMMIGGGVASAQKRKGDRVDVTKVAESLNVYKSASGTYIVIDPKKSDQFYYGKAKAMHRQWNKGSGGTTEKGYAYFWEPRLGKGYRASGNRYRHRMGKLVLDKGMGQLECGKRKTQFVLLGKAKAKKFLAKAKFYKPKWKREAYALARDQLGKYYFVDKLIREYGNRGFRVYMGYRGKMKKTRLVNVAIDSAGAVFATKKGHLRLVAGNTAPPIWIRKSKETKLIPLPLGFNRYLIYTGLGVYDGVRLGTPCDDH